MLPIDKSPAPLLEYFMHRNSTRSQAIYIVVLLALGAAIALLPIIRVDISVQGAGIIRPVTEKTEVKALTSDRVEQVFVTENQVVQKNDPILQLRTTSLDSKLFFLQYQKAETESYITDLSLLALQKEVARFASPVYLQEYLYFQKQTDELKNKRDKALKEFERNKKLFDNAVIAEKEFDDLRFQHATTENEYKMAVGNQLSKWQADLNRYRRALSEIQSNLEQTLKEKELYTIKAPVSGTIEQFTGIYPGSNVNAGQTVAVISPDSTLIAEVYISPKDIGYINQANAVKIQVDAFNYNEWGLLNGKVREISSDYIVVNETAMFKVRCGLDKNWLSLKNGIKGNLKKGMTIRARFLVAKRSLFQMLYQNMDDWINPAQYKHGD